jgi:hypothetical protein
VEETKVRFQEEIDEEYTKLAILYGDKEITMRMMKLEQDSILTRVLELKKERSTAKPKPKLEAVE